MRVSVNFETCDLDWFLQRLDLEGARIISERDVLCRCPAHDDCSPSLHVWEDADGFGVHCFAGCERSEIIECLEDAAPRAARPKLTPTPRVLGKVIAIYDYTDYLGNLLYRKRRFEPKSFDLQRPVVKPARTEGPVQHEAYVSWQQSLKDRQGNFVVEPVLYNLRGVGHTMKPWIADGEKDVNALNAEGVVATCSPFGMARWRDSWGDAFTAKDVTIVADRDEPGYRAASKLAAEMREYCDVRVVEAAAGKDAFDHLAAGYGVADFREVSGG